MATTQSNRDAHRRILELLDREDAGLTHDGVVRAIGPWVGYDEAHDAFVKLAKQGEIYEKDPEAGRWVRT